MHDWTQVETWQPRIVYCRRTLCVWGCAYVYVLVDLLRTTDLHKRNSLCSELIVRTLTCLKTNTLLPAATVSTYNEFD